MITKVFWNMHSNLPEDCFDLFFRAPTTVVWQNLSPNLLFWFSRFKSKHYSIFETKPEMRFFFPKLVMMAVLYNYFASNSISQFLFFHYSQTFESSILTHCTQEITLSHSLIWCVAQEVTLSHHLTPYGNPRGDCRSPVSLTR